MRPGLVCGDVPAAAGELTSGAAAVETAEAEASLTAARLRKRRLQHWIVDKAATDWLVVEMGLLNGGASTTVAKADAGGAGATVAKADTVLPQAASAATESKGKRRVWLGPPMLPSEEACRMYRCSTGVFLGRRDIEGIKMIKWITIIDILQAQLDNEVTAVHEVTAVYKKGCEDDKENIQGMLAERNKELAGQHGNEVHRCICVQGTYGRCYRRALRGQYYCEACMVVLGHVCRCPCPGCELFPEDRNKSQETRWPLMHLSTASGEHCTGDGVKMGECAL